MTSTYYVGFSTTRTITTNDWDDLELPGPTVSWGPGNGWSVNESAFTPDQIDWLETQPEFLTGQIDGPRPGAIAGDSALDLTDYVLKSELNSLAAAQLVAAGAFKDSAQELVDDTIGTLTPGSNLGLVRRTSTFVTTNITAGNGALGVLTGLSLPIVGAGRPITVSLYMPAVYHATANAFVAASVNAGNPLAASNAQLGSESSPINTNGPFLKIDLDTDALVVDQLYTFQVNVWGTVAGNSNCVAAAYCPIVLKAVSR